jgi:hypothetical protein
MSIQKIASVVEYSNVFNITPTDAEKVIIDKYLEYSTGIINQYCDRKLAKDTYSEWYNNIYSNGQNLAYTEQYPIVKVLKIGIPEKVAQIECSNANVVSSTISFDSNVFSLNTTDDVGDDITVELLVSDNKTLNSLKTNIEANNGWTFDVNSDYINYQTALIKPIDIAQTNEKQDIELAIGNNIVGKVDILDECSIKINQNIDTLFIKYIAGYTPTVDDANATSILTQGNVPKDLVTVTCHVANDLMSYARGESSSNQVGVSTNVIQAESIGDYSYSKFSKFTIMEVISNYSELLDRYCKKSFVC